MGQNWVEVEEGLGLRGLKWESDSFYVADQGRLHGGGDS